MADQDDDLDFASELEAALDGAAAPEPDDQPERPVRKATEEAFPQTESREYNRDEAGKFTKAEKDAAEAAAREQGATAAEAKQAVAQGWRPPYWNDEAHTPWGTLPEQARSALEQREKAFAMHLQKLAEEGKPLQSFKGVLESLNPDLQRLQAAGVTPDQYVNQLIQASRYLEQSPEEALLWLANSYQVSPERLLERLQGGGQQSVQVDPMVAGLQQQLRQVQETLAQREQREQQEAQHREEQRVSALREELAAWSKDKPHFQTVEQKMAQLAQVNPNQTLDQLYEDACMLHPQIRERILADQRKQNVQRARTAAVSPRGGPANGRSNTSPKMSIEEEIGSMLDGAI